jgi:hypothetical protein
MKYVIIEVYSDNTGELVGLFNTRDRGGYLDQGEAAALRRLFDYYYIDRYHQRPFIDRTIFRSFFKSLHFEKDVSLDEVTAVATYSPVRLGTPI